MMNLQINTNGAWRSICQFDGGRLGLMLLAVERLAKAVPDAKWRFKDGDGRSHWIKIDDFLGTASIRPSPETKWRLRESDDAETRATAQQATNESECTHGAAGERYIVGCVVMKLEDETKGSWRIVSEFDETNMAEVQDAVRRLSGAMPGSKWFVQDRDGTRQWFFADGELIKHTVAL